MQSCAGTASDSEWIKAISQNTIDPLAIARGSDTLVS